MVRLKELWRTSLLFRRIAAAVVFVLAAVLVSTFSHLPRAVALPDDDVNAKALARVNEEQIVLLHPAVNEGELVLSYVGSRNEVADVWLAKATLEPRWQQVLFPGGGGAGDAGRISYTTGAEPAGAAPGADTCHTTVEVRRAKGSPAIAALKLLQTDEAAGAQRFRQVVLDAGDAVLEVEAHTDAPDGTGPGELAGIPGCHKLLTVGDRGPVDLPPLPVHMVSHGRVDLHFNPANPAVPMFTGSDGSFEAVSLGDNAMRVQGVEVLPVRSEHKVRPRLEVRPRGNAADGITLSHLKIAADKLRVDVGRDGEKAVARADGASLYNYDLIAAIEKNPILSSMFGAGLVAALGNWVRRTFFPGVKADSATKEAA